MWFSRQEYWSRLPLPTPGDLSDPEVEPVSLASSALAGRSFTTAPPGKPRYQFSSVQSLSCVQLFATPWTTACQAFLSITNSQSLLDIGMYIDTYIKCTVSTSKALNVYIHLPIGVSPITIYYSYIDSKLLLYWFCICVVLCANVTSS